MLSNEEFVQWCQEQHVAEPTQAVVAAIRAAPPARRVRSAARNVSGRYPSRKMGMTIQFESHRNELAAIYAMEHDPRVLEYYDQPPSFALAYRSRDDRTVGHRHTADFFVLRTDGAGWEEWKTAEELARLIVAQPHRYQQDSAGGWRCPPGEAYAAAHGLTYRVRSSAEIDWRYQRNVLFLEDYLQDPLAVDAILVQAIRALVVAEPGITVASLLHSLAEVWADDLYAVIAGGGVWIDLYGAPLAEPERVRVFRDAATAQAYHVVGETAEYPFGVTPGPLTITVGTPISWDGRRYTIANAGATATALLTTNGALVEVPNATLNSLIERGRLTGLAHETQAISAAAQERLGAASPDDLAEANRRYALITEDTADRQSIPARTLSDWRARYRATEATYGCGYVGLLPQWRRRGNRTRRLPTRVLALIDETIARDYETLKQKRKFAVYGALARACEAEGFSAPSYKTFVRAVNRRPRYEQTLQRRGRRAAYAREPWVWDLELTTPRHGDRPFEIGHLDHTQLDIELVCSRTGHPLGRPWTTFLTDAFSRRVLAATLTFDSPSYRSCLQVLRECVHRHHRLPETIVVDGGPEFAGVYFETFLARYRVTKKTRPGAKPRYGSVCERLFGTTNTRFVHTLAGNTQLTTSVRQVTAATDPRTQACWTFGALHERLQEWAYEIYDTLEHPALGQSPRAAFAAGMVQGGVRPQRVIADDEDFRLMTLPTTPKGTARVVPSLGVKIQYIFYWADTFRAPEVEGTQVPVRYDPFDVATAYAFVRGRWVACASQHYASFHGRSERELRLASAELRRRQQCQARRVTLTARTLADFLASVEAQEILLAQRLRDAALRDTARIAEPTAGAGETDPLGGDPASPSGAGAARDLDILDVYEEYGS